MVVTTAGTEHVGQAPFSNIGIGGSRGQHDDIFLGQGLGRRNGRAGTIGTDNRGDLFVNKFVCGGNGLLGITSGVLGNDFDIGVTRDTASFHEDLDGDFRTLTDIVTVGGIRAGQGGHGADLQDLLGFLLFTAARQEQPQGGQGNHEYQ